MAIYMEYEGLKGNVTAKGYEGMVQLGFFKFEVSRQVNMKTGQLSNQEYTKPNFGVITMNKKLDGASPGLLREAVAGAAGKQVKFHFVRTGNNQLQEYLTYTFQHCLPVFFRLVGLKNEGGIPVERLYLSYTSVEVSYIDSGADNKMLSVQCHGYDLAEAKNL